MLASITTGVTQVIAWVGDVISSLFGTSGSWSDLLPAVGIAVGIGIVGFAIRTIKNVVWGY